MSLALPPRGTILLHDGGKVVGVVGTDGNLHTVVGVVGTDGNLHTHNMSLPPESVRGWSVVTEDGLPERLRTGMLAAARRLAANPGQIWTTTTDA